MKRSGCIAGDRRPILPLPSFIFLLPLESRTHASLDPQPSRSYLRVSSLRSSCRPLLLLLLLLHRRPLSLPPETQAVFLALKVNKSVRQGGECRGWGVEGWGGRKLVEAWTSGGAPVAVAFTHTTHTTRHRNPVNARWE